MFLVVTDFLLCGWLIVGTNFSEWVRKIRSRGEPILGGSKLNETVLITDPPTTLLCLHVSIDVGIP